MLGLSHGLGLDAKIFGHPRPWPCPGLPGLSLVCCGLLVRITGHWRIQTPQWGGGATHPSIPFLYPSLLFPFPFP